MAEKHISQITDFSFGESTETINVIPESGVTFNIYYGSGTNWIADDNNPRNKPTVVTVRCTRVRIEPIGGSVTITGGCIF